MSPLSEAMKKTIFVAALLSLLFLASCQKTEDSAEPITLFPAVTATEAAETTAKIEESSVPTVNKTYGQTLSQMQSVDVLDTAEVYRTEDSYRFEQKAADAAQNQFCAELYDPSTFKVLDCNVWNCVDDGQSVYYSIYIKASYSVESGDTATSGFFADIGIRKSDETSFDATDTIDSVVDQYSAFRDVPRTHAPIAGEDFESAAKRIATERLKRPATASEFVVQFIPQTDTVQVRRYDVFCEAQNDFEMCIPCRYSVYLESKDGEIVEIDPANG